MAAVVQPGINTIQTLKTEVIQTFKKYFSSVMQSTICIHCMSLRPEDAAVFLDV